MRKKVDVFCGSQMRAARHIMDISLDELAEDLNMEKSLLWQFEKGAKFPSKEDEKKIANALSVEPIFFYWIDTSPITEQDCTFSARMRHMR